MATQVTVGQMSHAYSQVDLLMVGWQCKLAGSCRVHVFSAAAKPSGCQQTASMHINHTMATVDAAV